MANRRIWTQNLSYSLGLADTDVSDAPAAAVYLAQEDLELIGWELTLACRAMNDITLAAQNHYEQRVELSQHPQPYQPGVIGRLELNVTAFTDTGAVRAQMWFDGMSKELLGFFPGGTSVTIKEGETLNVHSYMANNLGGIVTGSFTVILYFLKKGS